MVSAATREQLHRVTDAAGMLLLLVLEHPAMETAYVVNDTRDWSIGGIDYVGLGFRFKLPNSVAGEPARAAIEIDNVGRELVPALEALPPGASLQATFRLVSRAQPTVVDFEMSAPFSGVSITTELVTAVIGNQDAFAAPAIKMRYDQVTAPGLFTG